MAAELVGTVLDGKFQLEKALASGAAGDVYEAMHLGLGARVAVKVLRPGIPETADIRRKRFMREARVAARLKSEHVVRVYDIVAPAEGPTYIVMELLQGETLADRVRRVGALPVAEAVDFVLQAAKPLGEMHDEGIVHRDVKPSNLFLARDADGKERIKLLDFGVAAFQQPVARADSSLTLSEVVVGTPRYMAPEQVVASKRVDARADVWALGVTLYELLTGAPPFDGQTVLAVLNQIERQESRRLTEARADVPTPLAEVVHACLAKDPAGRPATARVLAESLVAATGPRAQPRRDPRPVVAAGIVAVLVVVAVAAALRPSSPAPPSSLAPSPPPPLASAPVPVPTPAAASSPSPTPSPSPAISPSASPSAAHRPSSRPS
ncbi:MAG TPA: serine/threonine-protein kinase, partial [Polyangiaceae bacterium]|nr:serine/threonine-protein kinase [Polyangiaceae bacterium]